MAVGDLTINGYDAFTRWGLNLEDGGVSALMTPAPSKTYIESKSRLNHGKKVLTSLVRYDERELTLPFHIVAKTKDDFFSLYAKFCDEVLAAGTFELQTRYVPDVVYRLVYLSCTQFSQFIQELAVFSLKVCEPDPTDRKVE